MDKRAPFAQSLFTALFWAVLVIGFPLAWILRDGLGPGAVESSGVEAVKRSLGTFYFGPVVASLAILAFGVRLFGNKAKSTEGNAS